ncbi:MAG: S24 family peptidase [Rikenella sp.]|nr:S24 family peptidase [Rikenella sp.]
MVAKQREGTPVYDIDVVCGTEGRDLAFTNERIVGYVNLPGINHASHIIEASGDSMSPRINSGDRIVVREIETWDYFVYGQAYVVVTSDYRLLKYIRKHPERPKEMVVLRSENSHYDDIELPIAAIRKLFVVENVLSVKNVL